MVSVYSKGIVSVAYSNVIIIAEYSDVLVTVCSKISSVT